MRRILIGLLAVTLVFAEQAATQWNSRSKVSTGVDSGLLIGGCVVAGVCLIAALAIPTPDPAFSIPRSEFAGRFTQLREFTEPVKVNMDPPAYGVADSVDASSFALLARNNNSMRVQASGFDEIVDLESAARQSRVRKTRSLIGLVGGGVGVILIASSQTSSSSSLSDGSGVGVAKALQYGAGASLVLGGLIAFATQSDEEKELERWVPPRPETPAAPASSLPSPTFGVSLTPTERVSPTGQVATEVIPSVYVQFSF